MQLKLSEPVDVIALFDRKGQHLKPIRIKWNNRPYAVSSVDYVYREKRGRTLYHIFCCLTDSVYFKISFNSERLIWSVEEISDGESS